MDFIAEAEQLWLPLHDQDRDSAKLISRKPTGYTKRLFTALHSACVRPAQDLSVDN